MKELFINLEQILGMKIQTLLSLVIHGIMVEEYGPQL